MSFPPNGYRKYINIQSNFPFSFIVINFFVDQMLGIYVVKIKKQLALTPAFPIQRTIVEEIIHFKLLNVFNEYTVTKLMP